MTEEVTAFGIGSPDDLSYKIIDRVVDEIENTDEQWMLVEIMPREGDPLMLAFKGEKAILGFTVNLLGLVGPASDRTRE